MNNKISKITITLTLTVFLYNFLNELFAQIQQVFVKVIIPNTNIDSNKDKSKDDQTISTFVPEETYPLSIDSKKQLSKKKKYNQPPFTIFFNKF